MGSRSAFSSWGGLMKTSCFWSSRSASKKRAASGQESRTNWSAAAMSNRIMWRLALLLAAPGFAQPVPVFTFQNNFWVNLHHFLRGEAYVDLSTRSLISDKPLVRLNTALAQSPESELARSSGIDPAIAATLTAAAPIYRAHRCPAHRDSNAAWIS